MFCSLQSMYSFKFSHIVIFLRKSVTAKLKNNESPKMYRCTLKQECCGCQTLKCTSASQCTSDNSSTVKSETTETLHDIVLDQIQQQLNLSPEIQVWLLVLVCHSQDFQLIHLATVMKIIWRHRYISRVLWGGCHSCTGRVCFPVNAS